MWLEHQGQCLELGWLRAYKNQLLLSIEPEAIEFRFLHCVVASTWAFEAQGPGSIPGGGARIKRERDRSK